jgi:hypothetical protein
MNKDLEIENLKTRVIDLEEKLLIFINNTENDKRFEKINEDFQEVENVKKTLDDLKDIKTQIFSIMALFFGIFAFISLDFNITSSLLSYAETDEGVILNWLSLCLILSAIIICQFIFFFCIYNWLLKPFFNVKKSVNK